MSKQYSQARYWILTIPHEHFTPFLHSNVEFVAGQLEHSNKTGFLHWQFVAYFSSRVRLSTVKSIYGQSAHAEPTKSSAADKYCQKSDTSVAGTQFSLGTKSCKRNSPSDWEAIWAAARDGAYSSIPADIRVRSYNAITRIAKDNLQPVAIERTVYVFWGPTGTGKSRRAWDEAGFDSYPKDPRTKFWDGYNRHEHVVMDEFRGTIDVANLLRWFDRYPVIIENKGSSTVLSATKFWITSNLSPKQWYPDIDSATLAALLRRLVVTEFKEPL